MEIRVEQIDTEIAAVEAQLKQHVSAIEQGRGALLVLRSMKEYLGKVEVPIEPETVEENT